MNLNPNPHTRRTKLETRTPKPQTLNLERESRWDEGAQQLSLAVVLDIPVGVQVVVGIPEEAQLSIPMVLTHPNPKPQSPD